MMILRHRIFLIASILALVVAGVFFSSTIAFSTAHASPAKDARISFYGNATDDIVLFFESSEDAAIEVLKGIKSSTLSFALFSCDVIVVTAFIVRKVSLLETFRRRPSLHSLWQKTTTTL